VRRGALPVRGFAANTPGGWALAGEKVKKLTYRI